MTWSELPVKLKVYISALTSIAVPVTIWAVWAVLFGSYQPYWIILAGLTLATVPFLLFLPSANAIIGIGDAYIMAIAMMYGVAPCIVATFGHTLTISILARRRPRVPFYRIAFNTSSMVVGAWLYSSIYSAMNRGSHQIADVILPAAALVTSYFLVNSILTSVAISWADGESTVKFWARTCMPLAIDFSVSAVAATSIVALYSLSEYAPLAAAPLIGIIWGWNKVNKSRVMEAERHLKEQEQLYLRTVESLALAVDAKDQTTYGHIRRVRVYAMGLARLIGIKDPNELMAIETGALLHDIGKLAIDDYILNKPGRLSKQEFEKIKMHATAGDEILQQIRFPFPVAKYVRYHHERWDGQGYPDGLKGEEIPLGARILSVADAFDAIRFSRPYKLSIVQDEAVEILRSQSGTVYDPKLVQLFVEHIVELEESAAKESESVPELSFRKYFEKVDQAISAADASVSGLSVPQDIPAELVQIAEFCSTMTGHLDLGDLFPIVARRLEKLIPYSTCAFYVDDGEDHVHAMCVIGKYSELIQGHKMSMGKGISGWVAAYRRPMINTGSALDFQGINGDFTSFKDALVVPIVHEDESLGTISLYAQEPISYSQNDLSVLRTLASFLAPLISDAKRHEAVSSEHFIDPTAHIHRVSYLTAIGPQLISYAEKNRTPISLIYLTIKNLLQITRVYGESVANSIIKRVAESIKPELRETDVLVRYGHQAFVAFLPGVRGDQANHCVARLLHQIRNQGFALSGQNVLIDCKAGISAFPKDGATIFALIQSAQDSIVDTGPGASVADTNVVDFLPRA